MGDNKTVWYQLGLKDAASAGLQQIEKAADGVAAKMLGFRDILGNIASLLSAFTIGEVIKQIIDLGVASDGAFRAISANLPSASEGIDGLKGSLNELAETSGRSLDSVHGLALEISKLGASSADDLAKQTAAAVTLSDATGVDASLAAQLLTQLRREFGLTGDGAMQMAADLREAAKGRVDIGELFAAFQKGTPVFQKLGIDGQTATRAIVALVESGRNARTIGQELAKADAPEIRELATHAGVASDSLQKLLTDAKLVEDGAGRAAQRIRDEFSAALERLGDTVLPNLLKGLSAVVALLGGFDKEIAAANVGSIESIVGLLNAKNGGEHISVEAQANAVKELRSQLSDLLDLARQSDAGLDSIVPKKILDGLSNAQLKAAIDGLRTLRGEAGTTSDEFATATVNIAAMQRELAARPAPTAAGSGAPAGASGSVSDAIAAGEARTKAAAELEKLRTAQDRARESLAGLLDTTEAGKTKSEAFAASVEHWAESAVKAKIPADQIADALARLSNVQESLNEHEAQAASDNAFKVLGEAMSDLNTGAIATLDKSITTLFAKLQDARNGKNGLPGLVDAGDAEALKKFDDATVVLTTHFEALLVATKDVVGVDQEIAGIQSAIANNLSEGTIESGIDELISRSEMLKASLASATDPSAIAKYEEALKKVEEELNKLGIQLKSIEPKDDSSKQVLQIANAWSTVGRSIIAAAQALGEMDAKTAATLQNVVTLGDGIAKLFAGDLAGGIAETATSLASLAAGFFGKKDDAEAKAILQQHVAALDNLTKALEDVVRHGVAGIPSGVDRGLSNQAVGILQTMLQANAGAAGSTRIGAPSFFDVNTLQEVAKEWGITIDDSIDGYNKFLAILQIGIPLLQAQYDAQQKQATEDYNVRLLRAQGFGDEADALAATETAQREYTKAVTDGDSALTLAALAAAEAAEATQRAAESSLKGALSMEDAQAQLDHVTDPKELFARKAKAYAGAGGSLGDLLGGFDLSNLSSDDIAKIDASLGALFTQLQTSPDSVNLAGLSIQDLISAILDLNTAAGSVAAGVLTAAQQMSAAESALGESFQIHGTDAAGQAKAYAGLYGFDLGDISSQSGVDAAIKALEALYDAHPELGHEISTTLGALRGINFGGAASAAASAGVSASSSSAVAAGFQALTTTQGDGLLDLGRRQLGALLDVRELLKIRVPSSALSPVGFGAAAAAMFGSAGSGGVTINGLAVHVTTAAQDAETEGREIGDAIVRELEVKLGRRLLVQKAYNGDISVLST